MSGMIEDNNIRHDKLSHDELMRKITPEPDSQTQNALRIGGQMSPHAPTQNKGLKLAEWISNATNVAPPTPIHSHRFSVAAMLSAGSAIGMMMMNAATGRKGNGVKLEKTEVLFKPLYEKLKYNPSSTAKADEWKYIAHKFVPAIFGGVAAYFGSEIYFHKRANQVKKAEYLEDVGDRISYVRSGPWAVLSALGALPGAKMGGVLLPVPGLNYPFTLGNRFTMGSGREVILPGYGDFWSENSSRLPFGQKGLLQYMFSYLTHNKDPKPYHLPEYASSLLRGWFPHASDQQVADFCNGLMEIRNLYYKPGGVPENNKRDLMDEFKIHFTKQGLENWLNAHELPVNMAHIKRGMAGRISDNIGAGGKVKEIESKFRRDVIARRQAQIAQQTQIS